MKNYFAVFFIVILSINLAAQVTLDPAYHTYPEILAELDSLQALYPDYIMIEQIGTTRGADPYQEPLPIYAAKLSDNVTVTEDEPKVFYAGPCHAEEVLGVEVSMYMINDLLEHRFMTPWRIWLENLEIWFVPSYNPEGLGIVMSGVDDTFRKNCRDNNLNGIFDFVPGQGGDIDGVDINRNYGFNWIHGDTLYSTNGEEDYDYYRGPAPFSEGETQSIKDLAAEHHFIYSINWHSSRSGNYSEKVYYSFNWAGDKQNPDFAMGQQAGVNVAALIPKEPPQPGYYEPYPSQSRKGSAHDWFYKAHGTIQLLIECGTLNLQPEEAIIIDTAERCSQGAYWLLGRTLGYQTEDKSMLTGHITESGSGDPLVAEIIVEEKQADYFGPRLSDELYGRFWRVLPQGTYDLTFCKKGYEILNLENVVVNNSGWMDLDNPPYNGVQLVPLESIVLTGTVSCDGTPVAAEIVLFNEMGNDTLYTADGSYQLEGFAGVNRILVNAEDCVPKYYELELAAGGHEVDFDLLPAEEVFFEDWSSGIQDWNITGSWAISYENEVGDFVEDSPGHFYENDLNIQLTSPSINLNGVSDDIMLILDHRYYIEHIYDAAILEIRVGNSEWQELSTWSGVEYDWHKEYIELHDYADNWIRLRFRLNTDETITDPGWKIAQINIVASVGADSEDDTTPIIMTKLKNNYPNPFNPLTSIDYSISEAGHVALQIFNVRGQLVRTLINEEQESGGYSELWNGTDDNSESVSSGIYFYKLTTENFSSTKKMILMK
jgi:zinc carboxypeptidase/type IX secretion system substrate protein